MLKIKKLTKTFKEKPILQGLDMEINHGEIGIFLGGSGAGKSTLLRILNHLETYDSGTLTLDEQPLNAKEVGMVFQHFNLFEHLSVEENIILPLVKCQNKDKSEAKIIANDLLKHYGLADKAHSYPSQLSGGQKQRLAIARTLALNPKVICLDEPTSALDPKLTAQVATYITELAKENRIILLTTHDTHLVKLLQGKLFLLENGKITETKSKLQLFLEGI